MFRSSFSEDIFHNKYAHEGCETWADLCRTLVTDVMGIRSTKDQQDQLVQYMTDLKFIPGGRYLYYAGRPKKFFNNCFLLRAEEDTREDWANLSWKSELCLSSGGGIGVDYSIYRPNGSVLHGTGGVASGPLPKMQMINELGRAVMQGGSRRSAIYASLNWKHGDIQQFLHMKDWYDMPIAGTDKTIGDVKKADFNFPAPMDFTNISVNYDTDWIENYWETGDPGDTFRENVKQALKTGEPGFSFNFWDKEKETLRNACTEVSSEDDSDVCNLGSINMGRIEDIKEIDTYQTARRAFGFDRNSLEELARILGVAAKSDHKKFPGFELWYQCLVNNPEAWKEMRKYNMQDVLVTEQVYLNIRPYITNHPNIGVLLESEEIVCPKCGSEHNQRRGYAYTSTGKYQQYQCQTCGGWHRSRNTEYPVELRKNLTVNTIG